MAVILAGALTLLADGGSWNKIRYSGGTVEAKVNPFDWNTTLAVSPGSIVLTFGARLTLRLKPSQVTALSYGETAYRRVADMVALSLVATPVALFGLLHKSTAHLIGIEFQTEDGKKGSVLLDADKNHYRDMLDALKTATGKAVQNAP